jgi:hypothetical protein
MQSKRSSLIAIVAFSLGPVASAFAGPPGQRSLQTLVSSPSANPPKSPAMSDFNIDVSKWPIASRTSDTASSAEMIININTIDDNPNHLLDKARVKVGLWGDPFPDDPGPGPYMNYSAKVIVAVDQNQPGVTVNIWRYPSESDGVNHNTGLMIPKFWPIPPNLITELRWIQGGWPGNDIYMVIPPLSLNRTGSTVTATTSSPCFFTTGQVVTLSPGEKNFPPGPKRVVSATSTTFTYAEGGNPTNAISAFAETFSLGQPAKNGDRHLQIYDVDHNTVYELGATHYGWPVADMWNAEAGAVFNLTTRSHARPSCPTDPSQCSGWTSADASGLPMSPGHLFYDEIFTLPQEINHGFSTTVAKIRRAPIAGDSWTQPYVWPASHTDGTGTHFDCPPTGARLRLKSAKDIHDLGGPDITGPNFTPGQQKFMRALQTYGFIVTDSSGGDATDWIDMSGVYDERWNQVGPQTGKKTLSQEWFANFWGDTSYGTPNPLPLLVDYFDVLELGHRP